MIYLSYFVALLMLAIRKMCYNLYADRSVYTVSSVGLLDTINYCLNNVK